MLLLVCIYLTQRPAKIHDLYYAFTQIYIELKVLVLSFEHDCTADYILVRMIVKIMH